MKPGVSPQCTTLLPILVPNSATALTVSGLVWVVLITSTSFITWTGLKKCRPTNLSALPEATAMLVMAREEVFEAKTQDGLMSGPSFL